MTYEGSNRLLQWIFETLVGHQRLVELLSHNVPAGNYRIVRGVIPEKVAVPTLFYAEVNPRPILETTNALIKSKIQFSLVAAHSQHAVIDEVQRILRDLFRPEGHPSIELGGILCVLYVELSPEGGALYEDTPRRCIRMDSRISVGYFEN